MALRDERQTVNVENVIPSRDPDKAAARIEREIRNGTIVDRVDLENALGSWEYRNLSEGVRQGLRDRFPNEDGG